MKKINNCFPVIFFCLICFIPQFANGKSNPDEIAKNIIKSHLGYEKVRLNEGKVVWFDLTSKGSNTDFYAIYSNGRTTILDVFTTRSGQPENLYHEVYGGYEMDAYHATISNKTFFISTNRGGSGGHLSVSIYDYDGIGKMRLVHEIKEIFQGWLWVVGNRILLSGNTQKYELKYDGNTFSLEKYQQRISCKQNGSHVLAYHFKDGKFFMTYDGKEIKFQQTGKPDVQHSAEPIVLGLDELIVLDDNMEEPQQVRLIMHEIDKLVSSGGIFTSFIAKAVGTITMSFSYNYKTWYEVEVVIESKTI